jgi:hypothetical protein
MSAVAAQGADTTGVVGILFRLPQELQTSVVLRALVAAELAGYQRRAHEEGSAALSRIRLSSSAHS